MGVSFTEDFLAIPRKRTMVLNRKGQRYFTSYIFTRIAAVSWNSESAHHGFLGCVKVIIKVAVAILPICKEKQNTAPIG